MSEGRRDAIIERDWAAVWDALPEAPPLVPRPNTAQITLRLPPSMLARLKAVAAARSLPYHALARSWMMDALRHSQASENTAASDEPHAEQLNLKLDQEALHRVKSRADELRLPYHRLVRDWIERAIGREEETLGLKPSTAGQPAIKELMVLLLHSNSTRGDEAVRSVTRLQKLLFVIEQHLPRPSRFYAYKYGPFNEEVNDAAEALRLAGFLCDAQAVATGPPSFDEMMTTAVGRSGPDDAVEEFALSERGHAVAERLRQSNRAYDELYARIRALRQEWDTPELVERVYEMYPKYAEQSLIRDEIAEKRARRRTGS